MQELIDYVHANVERGPCCCGKCIDRVAEPETKQPQGHTAEMVFFKVSAKSTADVNKFTELVKKNINGSFCNVDLFDGKEHGYMEIGGWIGDQGTALMFMGLGTVLGLWKLMTPRTILGDTLPDDLGGKMAGAGLISVIVEKS